MWSGLSGADCEGRERVPDNVLAPLPETGSDGLLRDTEFLAELHQCNRDV